MSNKEAAVKLIDLIARFSNALTMAERQVYAEAVAVACAALGGNNG